MTSGSTSRRSDGGFTLLEVLIAVVLLGLAATATIAAFYGAVRGSAQHRDHSDALTVATSAGDEVAALGINKPSPCPTMGQEPSQGYLDGLLNFYYQGEAASPNDGAVSAVPPGWPKGATFDDGSVRVVKIEFWNRFANRFGVECYYPGPRRVTIEVEPPSNKGVTETLAVVVSD